MEQILLHFIVSFIAGVLGSCVSKWLNSGRKGK